MFVQLAVIFAVVFSLTDGQTHSGSTFCQEKLISKIHAAKKFNDLVMAGIDDHYESYGKGSCKVRCKLTLFNKTGESWPSRTELHGVYTAPDFTWCGPYDNNYCLNGKCVGNKFCGEMLKKEVEEAKKKEAYPTIATAYNLGKKEDPCQVYCNMTTGHDSVIKKFTAPDYAFCGIEDEPKGYTLNMCKANKCLTLAGKKAKQPMPAVVDG